jgi:hypothetical protein
MPVPSVVQEVVGAYLRAVDVELPGLIEGLYLIGSVALGDFRNQASDIDFVAVTADRPDPTTGTALERVHARLAKRWPRPFLDGFYVTWDDLSDDPARAQSGPHSHEGRFHPDRDSPADPITWHTLARYGVACRGPAPADIEIWNDSAAVAAWTLENLDSYWRKLLDHAGRVPSLWAAAMLTPYGAVWVVTGVSRMHYTLATGDICSKEDAANYALTAFDRRWHRVALEALRIRRQDNAGSGIGAALAATILERLPLPRTAANRSLYRTPWGRRRDVLRFGDMVISDAHRRHGPLYPPP